MATIAEFASGFPGISTRIPFESGFISEVLLEKGYNTYCVGKWHLTPGEECNLAAYKGRWPLGRGFERFYGWLGGETNSYYPDLVHDNHPIEAPARPEDGYHLADDISGRAIEFIRDAKVIDPDKPFFMYFAPQAGHAPHLVPTGMVRPVQGDLRRRLRGDSSADSCPSEGVGTSSGRHRVVGHQSRTVSRSDKGPDGQDLADARHGAPLGDAVRDERTMFTRMAEVYAGYISYYDDRLGQVIDYLEESGQLDNTIIVVISDNGASGEGGPNGSFNEWRFFNGVPDTAETTMPHLDELGTPKSNNHYNTGWAWAFDTPYPYWKRWAGYEGGTADMCMVAWPQQIAARSEIREQYVHAVDVVPTSYDLLDIEPPATLKGYQQFPIEGESFAAAITDPEAPGKSHPVLRDARAAVDLSRRLAGLHRSPTAQQLGKLREGRVGALPPRYRPRAVHEPGGERADSSRSHEVVVVLQRGPLQRPSSRRPFGYRAGAGRATARGGPHETSTPSTRTALTFPSRPAPPCRVGRTPSRQECGSTRPMLRECCGRRAGVPGGHSLYIKDGRLRYTYNWVGTHLQDIVADTSISARGSCARR